MALSRGKSKPLVHLTIEPMYVEADRVEDVRRAIEKVTRKRVIMRVFSARFR